MTRIIWSMGEVMKKNDYVIQNMRLLWWRIIENNIKKVILKLDQSVIFVLSMVNYVRFRTPKRELKYLIKLSCETRSGVMNYSISSGRRIEQANETQFVRRHPVRKINQKKHFLKYCHFELQKQKSRKMKLSIEN